MAKTELFGRWLQGSVVVEDQGKSTGQRFFVHATTGRNAAGWGLNPEAPFASLAYAVTRCTAGRHDIIYLMPGHTETIATTITPLAGTRIVGLGTGQLMPQLTPAANNLVALTISAANVTVENVYINASTVAATATVFGVTGRHFHLRNCHMDMGANDRIGIRIGALGCYAVIEDNVVQVTANGPDSWITFVHANVDMPLIRRNHVIASDTTNEFDDEIIDFGGLAVRNPVIVDNVFDGADVAVTSIDDAAAVVGACFSANKCAGAAVNNDITHAGYADLLDGAISANKIAANALSRAKFALGAGEITGDGVVVTRATAALPQTAAAALFTVTGHCLLKRLVGVVTGQVGAVANATKLRMNSTGAGATTDLCATVEFNAAAVDSQFTITGTFANAMIKTVNLPIATAVDLNVMLVPGTVDLDCAGSDGGDGRVRWSLVYQPLESGAQIVAA
ncbi:MAG: hypothetical protein FJZ90_00035 [Chloroflexi bacterium]|nr:hypothetical protein [Chloroflexota bacterium]